MIIKKHGTQSPPASQWRNHSSVCWYGVNRADANSAQTSVAYVPDPIELYINSTGGSARSALGACDIIALSKTPVHTYGVGSVMSAGLDVFLAGHTRKCYKHTLFMFHQVSLSGDDTTTVSDMRVNLQRISRLQHHGNVHIASRTNLTMAKLEDVCARNFEWYIEAEEALSYNIVHEIIGADNGELVPDVTDEGQERARKRTRSSPRAT